MSSERFSLPYEGVGSVFFLTLTSHLLIHYQILSFIKISKIPNEKFKPIYRIYPLAHLYISLWYFCNRV